MLDRSLESSGEESEGFEQVEDVLGLDIESDEDDDDNSGIETLEVEFYYNQRLLISMLHVLKYSPPSPSALQINLSPAL